jgi:SAM-dependent MidA family methyltransferase
VTPLGREITELIARDGPMSIARYMELCLSHPRYGYYITRDPLGRGGDFTTAPEVSQMFGELLGIWVITCWQAMQCPSRMVLAELGPGRGTLMADVLRTLRRQPDLLSAAEVHLVETSPALRERQRTMLAGIGVAPTWHDRTDTLPEAPSIILANEFFDALPIQQFVRNASGWQERTIVVGDDGALRFDSPATPGAIRERNPAAEAIVSTLAARLVARGGALLAIDYGYAHGGFGDTLQAMAGHRFADPLHAPGEADLTAHVDFQSLAHFAEAAGAKAFPILSQHTILKRLGIEARAEALSVRNPSQTANIRSALRRLIGLEPEGMGLLFKALCIASPGVEPYGFDMPDPLIDNG